MMLSRSVNSRIARGLKNTIKALVAVLFRTYENISVLSSSKAPLIWGRVPAQPEAISKAGISVKCMIGNLGPVADWFARQRAPWGASIANTPAQADIVAFETTLYTTQLLLFQPQQGLFALLNADGARGGPDYLQDTVAPAFFIGINDPLPPGLASTMRTSISSRRGSRRALATLPCQRASRRLAAAKRSSTILPL